MGVMGVLWVTIVVVVDAVVVEIQNSVLVFPAFQLLLGTTGK